MESSSSPPSSPQAQDLLFFPSWRWIFRSFCSSVFFRRRRPLPWFFCLLDPFGQKKALSFLLPDSASLLGAVYLSPSFLSSFSLLIRFFNLLCCHSLRLQYPSLLEGKRLFSIYFGCPPFAEEPNSPLSPLFLSPGKPPCIKSSPPSPRPPLAPEPLSYFAPLGWRLSLPKGSRPSSF